MNNIVKGFLLVLGTVAVVLTLIFLPGIISIATAPFRGEVEKHELVEADGSYRIAAYDQFYQLCSSIQSQNDTIKNLEDEMDSATDEQRKQQLQSGITANKNTKAQLANEYNAKAASEYTRGQFKDSDLPYQISPTEERVTCNAS
jgi:hypothetical protein